MKPLIDSLESITGVKLSDMLGKPEAKASLKEDAETAECLKCGEECGRKLVGDESFLYCKHCNYYDGQ